MKRVAIFASGSGSNAMALLKKASGLSNVEVPILICNNLDAPIISKARTLTSVVCIPHNGMSRLEHEEKIKTYLNEYKIQFVFLAGYMRVLSPDFINSRPQKSIVNIHPSLLPDFPGVNGYKDAFESDAKISGITIHYVDEGIDTGPIIEQREFSKLEGDKLEDFVERGKSIENVFYPEVFEKILSE